MTATLKAWKDRAPVGFRFRTGDDNTAHEIMRKLCFYHREYNLYDDGAAPPGASIRRVLFFRIFGKLVLIVL